MPSPSAEPTSLPPAAITAQRFDEVARYSRQELFPGIGVAGQQLLARGRVALVGLGATGAATASLLARAGVGYLRLIDRDFVESSNLQRQILFDEHDAEIALPKAEAARRKIATFNSAIAVDASIADLVPESAPDLLADVDLILDATDNFETRYLINDFAVSRGVPWIYAGAVGSRATTMNVLPRPASQPPEGAPPAPDASSWPRYVPTACLACLLPEPPRSSVATCDTSGILGSAVMLAASLQSTEALKFLTAQPERMRRTLLSFDLWQPTTGDGLQHAEVRADTPDPHCSVCFGREFRHLNGVARPQITMCGRNAVQIHERHRPQSLRALHDRLAALPEVHDLRSNDLLVRFRRGGHTMTVFPDGRAVIQGTTDPAEARSLYARFLGA